MKPGIRTYREGQQLYGFHFFILNKGINAGKPMRTPCANCFVLEAEEDRDAEKHYWLCYALWLGKKFHPYIKGTAIPFLTLDDLKDVIDRAMWNINSIGDEFWTGVQMIEEVERNIASSMVRVVELQKVKRSILQVFTTV